MSIEPSEQAIRELGLMSYTEIHVTKKRWPDFGKADFLEALEDYKTRSRRFGGV